MSQALSQLNPKQVWSWFQFICDIPHPSRHEQALSNAITEWVKKQQSAGKKLELLTDEVGNLLIRKPATKGMENRKSVVLQAHLDMVPQKNEDTVHDFIKDPIAAYADGEWVTAKGTTLGADNGIGMATCLAVLADDGEIAHPDIEVLLTISEETGMDGAFGLKPDWLKGSILLNTDSEEEGCVYVGCAGGVDFVAEIPADKTELKADANKFAIKLKLKGLRGGHSGCDIHTGRGNAIILLAAFLSHNLADIEFDIFDFEGGSVRNAIPREAICGLILNNADKARFEQLLADYLKEVQEAYSPVETEIKLITEHTDLPSAVYTKTNKNQMLNYITGSVNGVITMSSEFSGVVESSLNLGVVSTIKHEEKEFFRINYLVRSLTEYGKMAIVHKLESASKLANATYQCEGGYPGWKPNISSSIMKLFSERYEKNYGHKPDINVIHAGLECGLFQQPYPKMDMLSFGPTIKFPHSPDEKVNIASVQLFWEQMIDLLKSIPEK